MASVRRSRTAAAFAGPQRRFWSARDLLTRGGIAPQLRADDGDTGGDTGGEWPPPAWRNEGIPFKGHALVFEKRELIGDPEWGFYEEFARGSTKKTLAEADIRLLQNHDPNFYLARTKAEGDGPGTYEAHREDDTGTYLEARMLPTSYAYDLALGLRSGVVSQMSVAFWPMKWELGRVDQEGKDVDDSKRGSMLLVRHLEIALTDESPVTFPAYPDTDASLRIAGMGMLLDAAGQRGADPAARASLIEAVLTGTVRDDAAPILRAALHALVDLAGAPEPGEPTRTTNPGSRYARSRLMLELDMKRRLIEG